MTHITFDTQKIVDLATEKQIPLSWKEAENILKQWEWIAEDNLIILFNVAISQFEKGRKQDKTDG